jgi:hypothetical protein
MSAIHAQVNSQIGLGPPLFPSKKLDALAKLDQQGIVSAGHAHMLALLLGLRVWHARRSTTNSRFENGKASATVETLIPNTQEQIPPHGLCSGINLPASYEAMGDRTGSG